MSKSEKKTDIWGDEYIQHYDDQGNQTGTSRVESDIWGDTYEQHRDRDGNKSSYSTHETDLWGDQYEQHRDQDGNKSGYSTDETDLWGDHYEQHRDEDGNRTGYTTNETDMWGDRFRRHQSQASRVSNSTSASASTRSHDGASGSSFSLSLVSFAIIIGLVALVYVIFSNVFGRDTSGDGVFKNVIGEFRGRTFSNTLNFPDGPGNVTLTLAATGENLSLESLSDGHSCSYLLHANGLKGSTVSLDLEVTNGNCRKLTGEVYKSGRHINFDLFSKNNRALPISFKINTSE